MFSITNPETHVFNLKRPVRTVALEPNFAKSSTRSLISGGMAGNLILHEKGWLGYKETVLHSGEGPIWQVRWRENLVAWANDLVCSHFARRWLFVWMLTRILDDLRSIGREDLRHALPEPDYLHRPPRRQPARRPVQMQPTLAR